MTEDRRDCCGLVRGRAGARLLACLVLVAATATAAALIGGGQSPVSAAVQSVGGRLVFAGTVSQNPFPAALLVDDPDRAETLAYLPLISNEVRVCSERLLANPSFETEDEDSNPLDWEWASVSGTGLIYDKTEIPVKTGERAAWLGGYSDAFDWLCQEVEVPNGALSARLLWHWQHHTDDKTAQDFLVITFQEDGQPVQDPARVFATRDNLDGSARDVWKADSADVGARGTFTLCIYATTNDSFVTSFYLDDFALEICTRG